MSDLYALEPEPDLPGLPGEPVVRDNEDQLLDVLAADVYLHALNCVQNFGDFHMALAVGPFQERLCRRLMTDPQVRQLPWQRTHLWAVHDEPDPIWGSRFTAIADLLEEHSGIPDANVHMPELDVPDPALAYEQRFQERLAWREKGQDRLDLAVLHLLPDGGLSGGLSGGGGAPGTAERLYMPARSSPGPMITDSMRTEQARTIAMSPRLVNATRLVAIAALGAETRSAVEGLAQNTAVPTPVGGTLRWYVDRPACQQ